MIFQASHHYHQASGHNPEATDLSSVAPHTPQHSTLTSPPPPLTSWVDHPPPPSISSGADPADFASASASIAHNHFNNNMMLTDIHHTASSGGYHQSLGSPASSTSSLYPLHNGTTPSSVPTHVVSPNQLSFYPSNFGSMPQVVQFFLEFLMQIYLE